MESLGSRSDRKSLRGQNGFYTKGLGFRVFMPGKPSLKEQAGEQKGPSGFWLGFGVQCLGHKSLYGADGVV